jgi:hypothetical protein
LNRKPACIHVCTSSLVETEMSLMTLARTSGSRPFQILMTYRRSWIVRRKHETERTPQIVSGIFMDNGPAVCTTTILSFVVYNALFCQHFAKFFTLQTLLLKGRIRPRQGGPNPRVLEGIIFRVETKKRGRSLKTFCFSSERKGGLSRSFLHPLMR